MKCNLNDMQMKELMEAHGAHGSGVHMAYAIYTTNKTKLHFVWPSWTSPFLDVNSFRRSLCSLDASCGCPLCKVGPRRSLGCLSCKVGARRSFGC